MWFAHSPGINEPKLTPASSACSQGGSPRTNLPPQNVGTACDSQLFIKTEVESANNTAAFVISSLKTRQIETHHHKYITANYPFIMSNPHYIKVHRGEDPSPDTKQQPASFSEQTKNWLREGHKDMPWHNIDSVAVSNTQDNSDINGAPSDTAATQGSDK
ncbi:hypothetical protein FOCG_03397 [Fusarium oxysporum f. sp. radicis-lycopersici 26381]|nr:hypothetical protein FOCG_03397 [Fusarium oxysporum f. sp. radicis-lycopersici 26381]